jgi:hypothetical protein
MKSQWWRRQRGLSVHLEDNAIIAKRTSSVTVPWSKSERKLGTWKRLCAVLWMNWKYRSTSSATIGLAGIKLASFGVKSGRACAREGCLGDNDDTVCDEARSCGTESNTLKGPGTFSVTIVLNWNLFTLSDDRVQGIESALQWWQVPVPSVGIQRFLRILTLI